MINREVEFINLARIDLLKGRTDVNRDAISQILLENYDKKFEQEIGFYYEDSICPPNEYVDLIIQEIKTDFYAATEERIEVINYWGHIHEKNMSTSLHNHDNSYVSVVVYLKIPKGSGSIVFFPRFNQYDNAAYASKFQPEEGEYYIFPGYLDHAVTRNMSDEKRISLSFNFKKVEIAPPISV